MSKYIDADKLIAEIDNIIEMAVERWDDEQVTGAEKLRDLLDAKIASLQQEQPEVDLEKGVEFKCIGKKVKMTVQELINYYIDSECVAVAEECGF